MPSRAPYLPSLVTGALLTSVTPAFGQPVADERGAGPPVEVTPTPEPDPQAWLLGEGLPKWRLRFEPSVAYLAPSGDLELPTSGSGRSTAFELNRLNLDSPQAEPMAELHFAKDRTRITFEGVGYSATQEFNALGSARFGAIPLSLGDTASISFEYQTFSVTGSRRVRTWAAGVRDDGGSDVSFGVDALAGLRFHRVDVDVRALSLANAGGVTFAAADELFAEPVLGTRLELDFDNRFTVETRVAVGGVAFGDRRSLSGDLAVSFTWRPVPTVGVQTGYRLIVVSLQSGADDERFEWTGALAGLYWGLSISF
jgi:hypothetical protein